MEPELTTEATQKPILSESSALFTLGVQDLQRTFHLGYVQAKYIHTCFRRMHHHGAKLAMVEDEQLVFHRDGAWFETYHAPSPEKAREIWAWVEDQNIASELKRRGIDSAASFEAIHELLDAHIAGVNAQAMASADTQTTIPNGTH